MDALFYRDTIQKKLLAIGVTELKSQIEPRPDESDKAFLDRMVAWVGEQFGGYSISHVNGRFRAERMLTMQDAAALQERGGRSSSTKRRQSRASSSLATTTRMRNR